jgi:hypothetical protein
MAPCDWDIDPSELCSDWSGYSAVVQDAAIHLATAFLWGATGRQYGPCPITIRPNQERCVADSYRVYPVWPGQDPAVSGPYIVDGQWRNCGCGSRCCCQPECAIVLRGPVNSITEVLVDGAVVDPSSYRVDETQGAYHLVRLDGVCWPTCQDYQVEGDEVGSFEITYEIGKDIPPSLEVAAMILACEYGKSLTGGVCRLPAKMTRLSRQGVEVEVEPPAPDSGKTGIKEVDDVISILNPSRRVSPPVILSPDLPERCDRITTIRPGGS